MNAFLKQPDEIIPISMDYTDTLNGTETISSVSVKVYNMGGTDLSATMLDDSSITSPVCKAVIKAGTANTKYKITFKATSSEGNIYEEDVFLRVLAI